MKKFNQFAFLACGLLLMLAATSVFAQKEKTTQTNKKSLENFAFFLNEKIENKQVDLNKAFLIELQGVLDKDGKLEPKTVKFTKNEGDAAMIEVGRNLVEALNDGGIFYYFKQLGIENIKMTLGQDESQTFAVISSEMPNKQRAATVSSSLNSLLSLVKVMKNKEIPDDERLLINNIFSENNEQVVTIRWNSEKSIVQEMISRRLQEFGKNNVKRPSGE